MTSPTEPVEMSQFLASRPKSHEAILEWIHAIPVVAEMGVEIEVLESMRCRAKIPRQPNWTGSYNSFHGGLMAAAADTIACFALLYEVDLAETLATTDMHIRYLRPCHTDLVVDATVIKMGKTLCPVNVELFDIHNKLVATASVTYIRIPADAQT